MSIISLTPGAGAVASMSSGAAHGLSRGIWTAVGQQLALIFLLMIAAAGLTSLLHAVPGALVVLQYVGGAYLIWVGIRLWLTSFREDRVEAPVRRAIPARPGGMLLHGFLVNATNPKALLALFVLPSRFLDPATPLLPQYWAMGVVMVGIDLVVMGGYTALGASLLSRLRSPLWRRRIDRFFGGLFLLAGVLVARG